MLAFLLGRSKSILHGAFPSLILSLVQLPGFGLGGGGGVKIEFFR